MSDHHAADLRVMHVFGGAVKSGVEAVVLTLADALRQAGGEVVLTPLVHSEFSAEVRQLGFEVVPLGKRRRYDVWSIPRLARLIRRTGVNVVHCHGINGAFYGCPAARMAGRRALVANFHGHTEENLRDVYRRPILRRVSYRYHLLLSRLCRRVITESQKLRKDLIGDGLPEHRVVCIRNGIDLDAFDHRKLNMAAARSRWQLPVDAWIVGTACRIARKKNLPLLLNATAPLMHADPQVHLVVAGEGPEKMRLQQLSVDLGIASRVHFTGWCDDVSELLPAFDVFALSSTNEGMPIAVLEAMAAAKPVVSTRVDGATEAVQQEETGLLVPADSTEPFGQALARLLREPATAARMGAAGRRHVQEEFNSAAMSRRMIELYCEVLSEVSQPAARRRGRSEPPPQPSEK